MLTVLIIVLILELAGISVDAVWCVCRSDIADVVLQKSLDYACGAGADCTAIQANGACYMPNTVRSHCSYAVNSYFQRRGQLPGSCDFSGTATATMTDPSYSPCLYPSLTSSPVVPGTIPPTTPATTPVITILPPSLPLALPPPPPPPFQGVILPPPTFTPTTTIPNTYTPITGGGVMGFGPPAGIGTPPSDGTTISRSGSRLLKRRRSSLLLLPSIFAAAFGLIVGG